MDEQMDLLMVILGLLAGLRSNFECRGVSTSYYHVGVSTMLYGCSFVCFSHLPDSLVRGSVTQPVATPSLEINQLQATLLVQSKKRKAY